MLKISNCYYYRILKYTICTVRYKLYYKADKMVNIFANIILLLYIES